jgi:hypothetical protein
MGVVAMVASEMQWNGLLVLRYGEFSGKLREVGHKNNKIELMPN